MPAEKNGGRFSEPSESEGGGDDNLSPAERSTQFFNMLLSMKMEGPLNAKSASVLAFGAKGAGLSGVGATLALSPKRSGGRSSDHFDKTIGLDEAMGQETCIVNVSGHNWTILGRAALPYHGSLIYHQLVDEVADCQFFEDRLSRALDADFWGPLYQILVFAQSPRSGLLRWSCTWTRFHPTRKIRCSESG